jgi:hypothetical protein
MQEERIIEQLEKMVAAGRMSREEADATLDRVRDGEHTAELRARTRGMG